MKSLQLLLTIVVIGFSVVHCYSGEHPSWIAFFLGWGYILLSEIIDILG